MLNKIAKSNLNESTCPCISGKYLQEQVETENLVNILILDQNNLMGKGSEWE